VIDSHCHLADKQFHRDLPEVIARAKTVGVDRMMVIADSLTEAENCILIAEKNEGLFATVGVHPHHAKDWNAAALKRMEELIASSLSVKAVGEIGLDYHYNFSTPDEQGAAFTSQVALAHRLDLPMVVHCREAVEDVWAIVREYADLKLVLHCCTEKWEDVERFVDNGWLLSFTGIATYPNAEVVRDTIRHCPLEQMMIETDAPYLAPIPHRGKRNEPAFVTEVAALIAREKGIDLEEIDRVTTANAMAFFGLPQ
jgi:TatD DNase family protein